MTKNGECGAKTCRAGEQGEMETYTEQGIKLSVHRRGFGGGTCPEPPQKSKQVLSFQWQKKITQKGINV